MHILAIFIIVLFAFIIYDMYDISCYFSENGCSAPINENNDVIPDKNYNIHKEDKIRCPPASLNLYKDGRYIQNKGFVNELMYRPNNETNDEFVFETTLIKNDVPLNNPKCEFSTDLPIANINVNYMLKKDSTKLI